MVRLKRIKKDKEFIEAYYTPEDSQEEGYLKIRLSDKEVVERRLTSFDGVLFSYFVHARSELRRICDEATVPESRLVMWY